MKTSDRETNPTRAQTISIYGKERAIEGQHSAPGQKLTLLLDHNETVELFFREFILNDEVGLCMGEPLPASFFCWRLPPARLDERKYLLAEDLNGIREDDPMQYVYAEWRDGPKTIQYNAMPGAIPLIDETEGYHCWCELVMRPRTQADNAHLYAQTPAAPAEAEAGAAAANMLTIRQAADYAHVDEKTIRGWIKSCDERGKPMLPGTIRVGRKIRILRTDLDRWLKPVKATRTPRKARRERPARKPVKRKS